MDLQRTTPSLMVTSSLMVALSPIAATSLMVFNIFVNAFYQRLPEIVRAARGCKDGMLSQKVV